MEVIRRMLLSVRVVRNRWLQSGLLHTWKSVWEWVVNRVANGKNEGQYIDVSYFIGIL